MDREDEMSHYDDFPLWSKLLLIALTGSIFLSAIALGAVIARVCM
jgi:hypothetical protein